MNPHPDAMSLPTWMDSKDDVDRARSALQTLVTQTLKAVRYQAPKGSPLSEHRALIGVDQVSMGVEILTAEGTIFDLSWCMQGYREGLRLTLGPIGKFRRAGDVDVVDVSASGAWRDNIGRQISSVAWSWYGGSSDESARSEAIWSVRLELNGGSSVVVALGEIPYGTSDITYIPDNLVVVFDRALAERYFLVDSLDSAWGTSLDSHRRG